jgi:hypothetical protein
MAINWVSLYKRYKGKWVALRPDETTVVGSGRTAKVAYKKAKENGLKKPILSYIPVKLVTKVGFLHEI